MTPVALALAGLVMGSQVGPDIKSSLLVSHRTAMPGDRVAALIVLKIPEPWHVYWKNPGDSGVPTQIDWELPKGWQASPPDFPVPKRLESEGIVSYAFERQLVLRTWLTVPEESRPGEVAAIRAKVKWLACVETCVLGSAELATQVKVGAMSEADPAGMASLKDFAATAPKRMPDFLVKAWPRVDGFDLVINDPGVSSAFFFADDYRDVECGAPQERTSNGNTSTLRLKMPVSSLKRAERLRGILTYETKVGESKAVVVDLPIQPIQRN